MEPSFKWHLRKVGGILYEYFHVRNLEAAVGEIV